MNALVFSLLLGALALIFSRFFAEAKYRLAARRHGCEPARASYPHKEPFLGLDLLFRRLRLSKENRNLPDGQRLFRELGNTFSALQVGSTTVFTIEPENIQAVFGGNNWGVGANRLATLSPLFGPGFITTNGEIWEHSRKLINPSFTRSNVSNLDPFSKLVDQFLEKLPKDESTIDLQPRVQDLFLDNGAAFILGRTFGIMTDEESSDLPVSSKEFLKHFHLGLRGGAIRMMTGKLSFLLPKKKWLKSCGIVHQYVDYHVKRGLQEKADESQNAKSRSLLLRVTEQTQDVAEVRWQVLQGMMAANDTTHIHTSNALFSLARSPESWRRLREECIALNKTGLDFESLLAAEFMGKVLKESQRLHPVFPMNARVALVDQVLPTGGGSSRKSPIFIPKGSSVTFNFYALHRNPEVFGKDVEDFNPDRWDHISPEMWEYLPFGGGKRACPGRYKATAEAAYVIARLALKYEKLESRDDRPWAGAMKFTASNANGCSVGLIV